MIISAITGKVCYVIYGRSGVQRSWPGELKMSDVMWGEEGYRIVGDGSMSLVGLSVAGLGDMNGDGLKDVALSTILASKYVVYVVYGLSDVVGDVMLSSVGRGEKGFRVYGESGYYTGFSISGGGDMNGDGLSELLIGGIAYPTADRRPGWKSGEVAYVVFGKRGRVEDVVLGNVSSLSLYGLKVEGGGGFIVS
eukprot:gene27261-biopygen7501